MCGVITMLGSESSGLSYVGGLGSSTLRLVLAMRLLCTVLVSVC